MSKQSLRKQIDKLQEKSKEILSDKNTPKETKLFIRSMLTILTIMFTLFLEKKTRKNSSNSGLPPSQNFGSNGNRNTKGSKEDKRKGSRLDNSRDTEIRETVSLSSCSECGANLKKAELKGTEDRQEIDIIYEIQTHIVTSEIKDCPQCGTENKGQFPEGMDGSIQYGLGIRASIINFAVVQMLSFQRIGEHYMGLVGRIISPSTMLKYISQLSDSLEEWEEKARKQILQSTVIHIDETSMRVNGKNYWIHTYSCGDLVLQFLHPSRGGDAIKDIGILGKYGGVLVHDCWSPYFSYTDITHALCVAHLLRELKFVEDSTGSKWATNLKKILQEAVELVHKRNSGVLTRKEYQTLQRRYRNILTRALKELPPFPEGNGKRGRTKHTNAQNLWLRLEKYETEVLLFAKRKDVDPTNNRAERDLRMSKVKKKVSGCFRTEKMAKHFCRITSYVKTMRYKGYSSLQAINLALKGKIPT